MKTIKIIVLLFSALISNARAQITVEECYAKARDNYPLVRQYDLIMQSAEYNLQNAQRGYLPRFAFSAQATYQTDVTKVPISLPGVTIPVLNKDQYRAMVEMNQTIWDGGVIAAQKQAIRARSQAEISQHEVDMYALDERVNGLFFGILLIDRQLELNDIYIADLQRNYDKITSFMAGGVANQADLDAVQVEIVGAGQNRVEMQTLREAYLSMLSAMIGETITVGTYLVTPPIEIPAFDADNNRPELQLFDALGDQLAAQRKSVYAKNTPKFNLFVQGAYGNPGLNMFKDKFVPYAVGGVSLAWNFAGLYTRRGELADIAAGIRNVETQRETFLFNTSLQDTRLQADINKYERIMRDDDRIIALRVNIRKASQAKVENGTMSVSDLVRDINSEQSSRQNKAIHEIELIKSIYELKNNKNN